MRHRRQEGHTVGNFNILHPSAAFDRWEKRCEKLGLSRAVWEVARRRILYFKTQSLCDLDRRDSAQDISAHFAEFERSNRGSGVFEEGRKDHSIWPVILSFVGVQDQKYIPEPKWTPPPRRPSTSQYAGWTATDFFRDLKRRIPNFPGLSANERTSLKLPVSFLLLATTLPRSIRDRDPREFRQAWNSIWPLLNKSGILNEYRKDDQLKNRVSFFLKDGF